MIIWSSSLIYQPEISVKSGKVISRFSTRYLINSYIVLDFLSATIVLDLVLSQSFLMRSLSTFPEPRNPKVDYIIEVC